VDTQHPQVATRPEQRMVGPSLATPSYTGVT
jgi:hypothetical protein